MLQSNEYFSGKVKSIGFTSSSTGRASVGVMAEGEYTFGTAEPEEMTVRVRRVEGTVAGNCRMESVYSR